VRKEKAIYHTMNLFSLETTAKCLVAEGWCPVADLNAIQASLKRSADATVPTVLHRVETTEVPPTFHRTNEFTNGFQVIIDAYGVATYREVNPAPFAIITFPFLFAVMFGDLGHGFIVTVLASLMVIYAKKLQVFAGDEIFDMIFSGRYIILLMGIFSMYTGLIYNDIFSKAMEIFHSGWEFTITGPGSTEGTTNQVGNFNGHVYPIGLDPAWHGTDNLLIFTNSYKMKMSVLFGVLQMSVGIVLSAFNHFYFRRYVSVFHEFLPQMMFLQSIFGYLSVTIIFKWCTDWTGRNAPSLLDLLINMFVSPFKVLPPEEILYEGQSSIQVILLVLALLCVPWMLFVKPCWMRYKHNKAKQSGFALIGAASQDDATDTEKQPAAGGDAHGGGHGHGEFEFSEVMVHQVIHTIEFCLGAVSNTASYLRLWALSLAHAQLSVVLWDMTLNNFFMATGVMAMVGLVGGFAAWFSLTIAILVVMEGLSAFLHALRLHWVEFNNKFYEGNGYPFQPFSLLKAAKGATE
jgi:V-type H+-transporting ATPase subunit a